MTTVYITVERTSQDRLGQERWRFWLNDQLELVLNEYIVCKRETPRHKFQPERQWHRLMRRSNNLRPHEVPLPDDVAADALEQLCSRLRVQKWSDIR